MINDIRRVSAFIAGKIDSSKRLRRNGMAAALTLKILQFCPYSSLLPRTGHQTPWLTSFFHLCDYSSFPSSVLSVFYLSPEHSYLSGIRCRHRPRRKAGIKRLLERKNLCDQTGCDTDPLNLSVCHYHLPTTTRPSPTPKLLMRTQRSCQL